MASLVLLMFFVIFLALRVPIAFCMGISSLIAVMTTEYPLQVMAQQIAGGIQSYPLMAVPFFILAGNMLNSTGITSRIFLFATNIMGHIKGGLAQVAVLANMIFAGISGSALADLGGLGVILIKAMGEAGYSKRLTLGIVLSSSMIGPIIPPSIIFVLYAVQTDVSIGRLFLAGILPGISIGICLMLYVYYLDATGKEKCPLTSKPTLKSVLFALRKSFFAVIAPAVILFAIIGGIVTPTEAGALAVFYSFFVGLIYGDIEWKEMPKALMNSVLTTSLVMVYIGFATIMGWIFASDRVPQEIASILLSITTNKYVMLFVINVFLLILGCLLETVPALIVTIPVLLPLIQQLKIDPVHFGVVMSFNLIIGLITPPMGLGLYIANNLCNMSFEEGFKAAMPFLIVLIASLFIITYIPAISLFLPNLLMGK